ncbi:MAG: polyprenyl synthetase family protein [Campylobacteraceae bacterium]|nr:polyprenyl synthetase family protein [Campylobacteraceae bacterium]MBT4179555.1 polyprenyl synthetase family protein [Campylobacteraceae bacterium]MBT4572212.1 polyprenyl synthetase family protein [Campylobacteraceae bacterium]MBT4708477.1 polyprenyl synthetase family protein [Campylobacteraceae bacterium]MBT5323823.1 polyprenyl synthetase family protein [Campylobacteraceae bacterium]
MQNNTLLANFEDYLNNNLPQSKTFHPIFEEALQDMLNAGGKRFRPMLILSIVQSLQPLLLKNSMPVALGVEFLHTYSLVHDDLPAMDNADLRRGHPTLHKSYDEVTAILVGDALNTHSFNLIANAPLSNDIKIELIKTLSSDGGIDGMIIGQAIDCFFENQKLELNQLEFLHIHKTAKLIAGSLKMGAIICNLDIDTQNKLYNFGIDIGLLFQIQDDIIDETATEEEAGKTTANDEAKNSFVNLLGLNGALDSANTLASKCENNLNSFDINLQNSLKPLLSHYLYRHK